MLREFNEVKRFLGTKFGMDENVPDGVYAIPTKTSKGNAFMRFESKNNTAFGSDNFKLYWDENLTISWYDSKKPFFRKESKFSKQYRKLQAVL